MLRLPLSASRLFIIRLTNKTTYHLLINSLDNCIIIIVIIFKLLMYFML